MKKVFAIACLLVVLVMAVSAMAAADQGAWRLYLKADNGAGSFSNGAMTIGVATNGKDGFGVGQAVSDANDGLLAYTNPGTSAAVAGTFLNRAWIRDVKSPMTPENAAYAPNGEKVWSIRVAGYGTFAGPLTLKLTMVSALAGVPPASGGPVKYFLRMVDNKGKAGAFANGTVWDVTMPAAYTTETLLTLTLPNLNLTSKDESSMLAQGYQMEFVQATAVPEPGTVAAALALLAPAGLMFRRRRA